MGNLDVVVSLQSRIASLKQTVGEQADQIGGLTSELEQLRDVYTATAELLQIREEQVQQLLKDVSDSQQQHSASQTEVAALRLALVGADWIIKKLAPHEAMAIMVRGYKPSDEDIATGTKYRKLIDEALAPQPDNAIQTQSERNSDAIAAEKE